MTQRVGRGIALLFHDRGIRRGEWSAARHGRTLPPGKTRYPLYRRLGAPQGRSGRAENLVPPRDSIPDRPVRSSVAIPTELPGPHMSNVSVLLTARVELLNKEPIYWICMVVFIG